MQHILQMLKQQINQLKCDNKSSTSVHIAKTRRSTFVSSLFGIATEGDLNMAKNEIKRTQSMVTFLLSHETAFTRDLESLNH